MRDSKNTYQYNTREEALAAVQQDAWNLQFVPPELRTLDICMTAVQQNCWALQFMPEAVQMNNPAICLAAVQQNCWVLQFVPEAVQRQYPHIALAAVQGLGMALQFVPEKLRTLDICMTAVQQDAWALQFVPPELRTDEICMTAVQQDAWALQFVPEAMQMNNPAICLAAVQKDASALQFVPKELNTTANNALLTLANDSVSDFKSNLSLLSVIPTVSLELINTVKNVRWMREFRHLFLIKLNTASTLQKFFNTGEQGITDNIFSFISPKAMSLLKDNNDICKATLSRAELELLLKPHLDAKQAYRSPIDMVSDYLHGDPARTDAKTDSATPENR